MVLLFITLSEVIMKTVYEENGFKNRKEYLIDLADTYGVDKKQVFMLASMLGESEDFDGLVTSIQDDLCDIYDY